jgi:tetratricopeptide (TPR) repeat protein
MASVYSKNGDPLRARACLDAAIRACPESPEAWDAKAAHLAATGAPPSEAARFREEAIRRFSNVPDLKVRHQQALAEIRRSAGDSLEAQKIERQISTQNRRSRSDLSVSVAAQKVRTLLDAGDIDAAAAEFHRQLLSIGKEGGGNFANEVAVPFLTALLESGNKTRARRTLAILRRELSPERGQPLDLLLAQFEAASR